MLIEPVPLGRAASFLEELRQLPRIRVVGAERLLEHGVGVSQELRSSLDLSLLEEENSQVHLRDRRRVVLAGSIDRAFDFEDSFKVSSRGVEIALSLEDACERVEGGGDIAVDVGAEDLGQDL